MNRRDFFKGGSLVAAGLAIPNTVGQLLDPEIKAFNNNKIAKNIIFLVSDGMSQGTLTMGDLYCKRVLGRPSHWLNLYEQRKVQRGVMDMASANSIVTDSAAASSSWGSGFRVMNGALNIGVNGEEYTSIWKKFKNAGKKAGCVTTVQITHATPAGFLTHSKSRNSQEDIAENYAKENYDVLMGGGSKFFDPSKRKDKKDLFSTFKNKGYTVAKTRNEMLAAKAGKPILGTFYDDALPYTVDRENIKDLANQIPTLAEMTEKALELLKDSPKGFVLQVEGGKVDWAAHANCISGLLRDQVAFDEAVAVAVSFAEKNPDTLVIMTSDHGNANPGLIYGKEADKNFDSLQHFAHSNEWILNGFTAESSVAQVIERIEFANKFRLTNEEASILLLYYKNAERGEDGLYNYKKLPFATFAEMQKKRTSVGWIGTEHSADYTEIAMFGPGSQELTPFIKNTDLHSFMLKAAGVNA